MSKIEELRSAYASIKTIDPEGLAYKQLCLFLDARSDEELKELALAGIKWVSSLSLNRCIRRGVKVR